MAEDKTLSNPFGVVALLKKISNLTASQRHSVENFDESKYAKKDEVSTEEVVGLYRRALAEMGVGTDKRVGAWQFSLQFKGNAVVDGNALHACLRLLPDNDVKKVRLFNRLAGQQLYGVTTADLFSYEDRHENNTSNNFFMKFSQTVRDFAALFGRQMPPLEWPARVITVPAERDAFRRRLEQWRGAFVALPAMSLCLDVFHGDEAGLFNSFFHTQRQFDSDNWKDYDEANQPCPQPIPRIIAYRDTLKEMGEEFGKAESSVSMCFDYCRMKVESVIPFIREAEEAFLKLVNHLDDDYPVDLDFAHKELHERSTMIKQMMFPLRCLFFEQLETLRGASESNDNTIDSYLDMSLGKNNTFIPKEYHHFFEASALEPELQTLLLELLGGNHRHPGVLDASSGKLSSVLLVTHIQGFGHAQCEAFAARLADISLNYEKKFKSDENNMSRRIARLLYLYMSALTKKETMRADSEKRLEDIKAVADRYTGRADLFGKVDIADESAIRKIKDEELPMMASPDQMEAFYNTQKVVQRLAEKNEEFGEVARQIEQGLQAAMAMMKRAEEFMERMIKRMFVNPDDSRDLLDSVHNLVALSYKTQQALADMSKKEATPKNLLSKKIEDEIVRLKADIQECKTKTVELQNHLRDVLGEKRELITKMRITQDEKDAYRNQLRMITMMTINSMQAQSQSAAATA